MTQSTITSMLDDHASNRPAITAIVCAGIELDYATLRADSIRIANGLAGAGVTTGVRVAYLGKESVDYYRLVFACARLGAVLVPINFRLAPPEVEHIVQDSGSTLVLVDAETADVACSAALTQRILRIDDTEFVAWLGCPAEPSTHETPSGRADPMVQLYTSGTTGLPKGWCSRSTASLPSQTRSPSMDWTGSTSVWAIAALSAFRVSTLAESGGRCRDSRQASPM